MDFIVQTESKKDAQLLKAMLEKMNYRYHSISEEDAEDKALAEIAKKARTGKRVSKATVMKSLKNT